VLRLLVLGHTNRETGQLLHVSVRTVESHRLNLRRKLGVSALSELVRVALAVRSDGAANAR
jgi:DNA-binding CsgD family transcriptional regulator